MMINQNNILSDRLILLRRERNLSQYNLADLIGFSRGVIANYEQGRREPDYNTLIVFANFYSVSVDYLLGRTDERQAVYNPLKLYPELIESINTLTAESREELSRYIALLKIKDSVNDSKKISAMKNSK